MATISPPQVEAYLYDGLDGVRSVTMTDAGGGPFTFTLSATKTVSDALDDWEADANGSALAGTFAFEWVPSTQQVRLASTGVFTITLNGSLPAALGFSAATHAAATSYASDLTPTCIANPGNIDYDPPRAAEETELQTYRWGRVSSRVHYRALVTRLEFFGLSAQADSLLSGPMLTSRLRAYPCAYVAGAYAADNLTGYLDVYPFAMPDSRRMGSGDGHTIIGVAGSVAS